MWTDFSPILAIDQNDKVENTRKRTKTTTSLRKINPKQKFFVVNYLKQAHTATNTIATGNISVCNSCKKYYF